MECAFISVIVPVYNEELYLDACVGSMLAQDYPKESMEWFFVDGMSTDRTLERLEAYQSRFPGLIHILKNPDKTVPYAMNLGIRASKGVYIIRLDAHAEYAEDYFTQCVRLLEETGADNVGGVMETKARTPRGELIARMLSCPFGVGNSQFRINGKDGYVDTVPFGAFRRDIFDRIGLYDERLSRNQDSELNYRIIHSGGKIYLSNRIRLAYYCRETVGGIMKMGLTNGRWNIITSKLCPGSMRLRHFIPCLFVLSLIGLPILTALWRPVFWLFLLELLAYAALDLRFSAGLSQGLRETAFLAGAFPCFHCAYGWGSLLGILDVLSGKYRKMSGKKI